MDLQQKKLSAKQIAILFTAIYFVSYMTRINFGAVIADMENTTGISRSQLSLGVTASFISYGLGQVVSGIWGDRFSPKRLVLLGLGISSAMNALLPVLANPIWMTAVWFCNGFAQSLIWPPLVRLMAVNLSGAEYNQTVNRVSWGASIGTMTIYLVAPVILSFLSWRGVFWFCAILGAISVFVWHRTAPDAPVLPREERKNSSVSVGKLLLTPLMLFVMLCIILQGSLRDGITTWMPTFISDQFDLGSAISILTGCVLPLFGIFSMQASTSLYTKKLRNPLATASVLFGVGGLSATLLYFCGTWHPAVSVIATAVLTGAMYGVNLMLIAMVPLFFKKTGMISTVSGILNACTYVGSAISTYGIALISQNSGWDTTILLWAGIAWTGTLVLLFCIRPWLKQMGTEP